MKANNSSICITKYKIYEPLCSLIMVKFNEILPYVYAALILTG